MREKIVSGTTIIGRHMLQKMITATIITVVTGGHKQRHIIIMLTAMTENGIWKGIENVSHMHRTLFIEDSLYTVLKTLVLGHTNNYRTRITVEEVPPAV